MHQQHVLKKVNRVSFNSMLTNIVAHLDTRMTQRGLTKWRSSNIWICLQV